MINPDEPVTPVDVIISHAAIKGEKMYKDYSMELKLLRRNCTKVNSMTVYCTNFLHEEDFFPLYNEWVGELGGGEGLGD